MPRANITNASRAAAKDREQILFPQFAQRLSTLGSSRCVSSVARQSGKCLPSRARPHRQPAKKTARIGNHSSDRPKPPRSHHETRRPRKPVEHGGKSTLKQARQFPPITRPCLRKSARLPVAKTLTETGAEPSTLRKRSTVRFEVHASEKRRVRASGIRGEECVSAQLR